MNKGMKYEEIIDLMAMAYNQGYSAAAEIMKASVNIAQISDDKLKESMMKALGDKFKK